MAMVRSSLKGMWNLSYEGGTYLYTHLKMGASFMFQTWQRGLMSLLVLASLPFLAPLIFVVMMVGGIFLVPFFCGVLAYYALFHPASLSNIKWFRSPKSVPSPEPRPTELVMEDLDFDGVGNSNRGDMLGISNLDQEGIAQGSEPQSEDNKAIALIAPGSMQDDEVAFSGVSVREASMKDIEMELQQKGSVVDISFETPLVVEGNQQLGGYEDAQGEELILGRNERGQEREDSTSSASSYSEAVKGDSTHEIEPVDTAPDNSLPFEETLGNEAILEEVNKDVAGLSSAGRVPEQEGTALGVPSIKKLAVDEETVEYKDVVLPGRDEKGQQEENRPSDSLLSEKLVEAKSLKEIGEHSTDDSYPVVENQDLKSEEAEYNAFHLNDKERDRGEDPSMTLESPGKIFLEARAGSGDEFGAKPVEVSETKFGEEKEAGPVVDSSAPTTEQLSLPVESVPVKLASPVKDVAAIEEAAPVQEAEAGDKSGDEFGAKPVKVSETKFSEEKEAGPLVDSLAPTTEQRSLPVESEPVKLASPVEDVAAFEEAAPVQEAEAGAGSVDEMGAEPVEVSGAQLSDEKEEAGSVVDSSAQTTEQRSLPVESESVKLASPIKDVAAIEEAAPMEEAESTQVGTTEAQSASEELKALGEPEHLVGSEAIEEKEDDHLVDRKQELFDEYKVESKELDQAVSVSTQPLLSEAYLEHPEDELPSEDADQQVDDTTAVEGESEPNYESADESFSHSDYEQEQVDVIQTNARKLNDGTGNGIEDDTELYLKGVGGKQDVPVDEVDAPVVQEVDLHGSQPPLEEVPGVEADAVAAPAFDPAAPVTEEKPLLVEDVAPLAGVASVGVGAFVEEGIANKTPQPAPQVTEQKLDIPAPTPEVLKKVEAPAVKDASMHAREVTKKSDADPFAKQVVTEDEALTVKKETEVPLVVSEPVSEEKHVPLVEEDVSALSVEPEVSRMEQRSLQVESEPVKLASPVQDVPAIAEAAPVEEAEAGAGSVDEFGAKPVEVSEVELGEEKEAGLVVDSSAPTTEQRYLPVESEPVKLASAAQDVPGIAEAAPLEDAGAGAGSVDEYGAKPLEVSEAQLGEEKGEAGPVVDSSAPTTEQRSLPVESESVKLVSPVADVPAIEEAAPLEEAEAAAESGDELGLKDVEVSEAELVEEEAGPVVDSSAPTTEQRSLSVESEPVKFFSTVENVPAIEEAAEAAPLEEADSAVEAGDEFGTKPVEVAGTKFGEEKEAGSVVDSSAPTTEQRSLPVESESVQLASPVEDVAAIEEAAPVQEAVAAAKSGDEPGGKPLEVSETELGEEKGVGPVVDSSAPTTEQRSLPVESESVKLASPVVDVRAIAEAAPLEEAEAGAGSIDELGAKPEVSEAQFGKEEEGGPVVDSSAPTVEQRSLPVESEPVKLASPVDVPAIEEAAPVQEAESAAYSGDDFGAKRVDVSGAQIGDEKEEGGSVVDSSAPTTEQRSLPVDSEPVKLASAVADVPVVEEAAPVQEAEAATKSGDEPGAKDVEVSENALGEEEEVGTVVDSSAATTDQRSLPVESEPVKLASPVDVSAVEEAAHAQEAESAAELGDEFGAKAVEVSETEFGDEKREAGSVVHSSAPTTEQRSLPVDSEPVKFASAVRDVPAIKEAAAVEEAVAGAGSVDEYGAKPEVSEAQFGKEEEGGPVVDSSAPTVEQRSLPVESEPVKLASPVDVPAIEEAAPVQEVESAAYSGDDFGAKRVDVSGAQLGDEKEEGGSVVDSSAPTTEQRSLPVDSEPVKLATAVADVPVVEEAAPVQEAEAAAKSGNELGGKLVEVPETELGEENGEAGPVVDTSAPTTEQRSLPVDSEPVQLASPVADVPAIAEAAAVEEAVAGAGSVDEYGAKPEVSEAQFGKEEEGGPVVDSSAPMTEQRSLPVESEPVKLASPVDVSAVEEAAHAQEAESAAELGGEFGAKAVEVSETEFGDEKGEAGSVVDSSAPTTEQRSLPVDSEPVKFASAVRDVPDIEEAAAVEEAGAGAGSLNEFGAKAVDVSGTQLGEEKEVSTLVDSSAPTTDQQSLPVESEPMKFASAVADVPAILEGASLSDGVSVEDAALVEESYAKKGEEWESLVLKGRDVEAFIKKAGAPGADAIIAEPDEVRGDVTEPSEWTSRVADLPSNEEAAPLKVSVSAEEALSEKDAVTPVVEEKELITPVAAVEMMDVGEMPMVVPPAQEGAASEAEAPVVEERKLDANMAAGSIGEEKFGKTSEAPVTEPEVTKDVAAEEAPDMREVELSLAESEPALEEQEAPEVESLAVPDLEPEVPVVAEKSLPVQELQVEATPVEESPPLNVDDSMAVNENLNQALKDRSVKVSDRELENASNIAQFGEQGHGAAQKLEEYSEKDKVLESHTGQDVFPTLKPLNVVQSKDSAHDEQVDGSDSVLTRPPTQRRISFEDADEEVNMGAPSSAIRRTGAEGTNSNFVFKSHLGRDHRTHRHSAPDFLGTQTWVREAPFYSPQSSSRGHKKAKYKKWSESDGGRPARTLSAPFSDSTGVHMGDFETLLQSWQERDKATHSPTRLSPSSSPISPAEIGRQIREEINTIQKIIGQDIPPQYSLWKEVETLCQIVGMQLPYMGDVSDLTKARNGLDLLKVVVGIK